ncbi:MAG: ECF transporter S component [Ruminococcus sp.]
MTQHQSSIRRLSELGLLSALLILLALTPLGYLHLSVCSITFCMIPVAIGAARYGSAAGAGLGALFGATSFLQCFGGNPMSTALFSIHPFVKSYSVLFHGLQWDSVPVCLTEFYGNAVRF